MPITKSMQEEIQEEMERDLGLIESIIHSWLNQDGEWVLEGVVLKITDCENRTKATIKSLEKNAEQEMADFFQEDLDLLQEDIENIFQDKKALRMIFIKSKGLFSRLDVLSKDFDSMCQTLDSETYGACEDEEYELNDSAEEFFMLFTEMAQLAHSSRLVEHSFFKDWQEEFKLLEEKVRKDTSKFSFMQDFLNNLKVLRG